MAQIKTPKTPDTPLIGDTPQEGGFRDNFKLGLPEKDKHPVNVRKKLSTAGNMLSRAKVSTPFKAWRKGTGSPAGSAAALAMLAGAGAYYGAPWAAKKLRGVAGDHLPMSDEEIAKMRKRMTILAALGAGGLSVLSNLDMRNPGGSMTSWDYKIPKKASLNSIRKKAMLGITSNTAVMQMDIIPLDHAKEIVANDKYLTSGQKAAIGTIFDNTPEDKGTSSMSDITRGAVRAGLGFAGGAIAGYALGKIFALPTSVTRAASVSGGLANALRTSGLIS